MVDFPLDAYGLIRRAGVLAGDLSDDDLVAAVRADDIRRLAPGVYVPVSAALAGAAGDDVFHRLRAIGVATSERDGDRSILSHSSAAAMLGLSLLKPSREKVHFLNGSRSGGYVRGHRHVHPGVVDPADVVVVDGLRVTSAERTAVDVACSGDFAQALVAFDSALRLGADSDRMESLLTARRRGSRPARRAFPLADGHSESVGESWSRAQMIDGGLPVPSLQTRFRCGSATYRTDYHWASGSLVGEFDGMKSHATRPHSSVGRSAFCRATARARRAYLTSMSRKRR